MGGRIAVDVDGVLADTVTVFLDEVNTEHADALKKHGLHPLIREDLNEWGWGAALNQIGLGNEECITVMQRVWRERAGEIPLNPSTRHVTNLARVGTVDIVTANRQVDAVAAWINHHGIPYNQLRREEEKHRCDYPVFIDDNPVLADKIGEDQVLYLYDQPWNQDAPRRENVIRVSSIHDAYTYIARDTTR